MDMTDREFTQIVEYIKANYGIKLGEEKKALLLGRLQNTLAKHNLNSFSEFYNYIIRDKTGTAAAELANAITTNHTYFMREVSHFNYFKDRVLPYLRNTVRNRDLRIWSAGCSSGQEPYTLAMILDEFFGKEKECWDVKILATDLSSKVLEAAQSGIYRNDDLAEVPYPWRQGYFRRIDREYSIIDEPIRNEVIFRKFNLITDTFPFKRNFHVIFCRNVMIYFDAATRNELVRKFYDSTENGGYLFIGHSESLDRAKINYKYIMPSVYRKEI